MGYYEFQIWIEILFTVSEDSEPSKTWFERVSVDYFVSNQIVNHTPLPLSVFDI